MIRESETRLRPMFDGNIGGFIFGTAVSFSVESVSGSFLGAGLRRAFFVSVPNSIKSSISRNKILW